MRVTKAMLERTIASMLKSSRKLTRENRQLRELLVPNAWLVEPIERAKFSLLMGDEPGSDCFKLDEGYMGDDAEVSDLCRDVVKGLVGQRFMPGIDSYTAIAIVPIKRTRFVPRAVASHPVLR